MKARILLFAVLLVGLQQSAFSLCIDNTSISLIYKKTNDAEIRMFDVDYATYRAKYDQIWNNGYRLKDLDVRTDFASTSYSAVWVKSTVSEVQYYGITHAEFKNVVSERWEQGWRIFLIANYVDVNSVLRYTVVFRPGTSAQAYLSRYTKDAFQAAYKEKVDDGFKLNELEMYRLNDVTYYTGVFQKSAVPEVAVYEVSFSDMVASYKILVDLGWRLNVLDSYYNPSKNQVYYTGYFRKEASNDSYVFGYTLYDFESILEDKRYADGYTIQFMTIAGKEDDCNDVRKNPVRSAEDIDAEWMSSGAAEPELFVSVSPNPSSDGNFTLSSQLFESEEGVVEILKMDGSKILSKAVQMNGFNANLDLSELQPGIYIMNIILGEMNLPKKIIIQ